MKVLIIDNSTEAQANCAKRFESINAADAEMLDLKFKLSNDREFLDRLSEADIIVLGSGLADRAVIVARQAVSAAPWLQIIMFVTDEAYGGGAFRAAHSVGVRKVFPDSASPLDFLQELVAIHAEFRREGRAKEGKVITITHAKGGVGATSISAALGEVCSVFNKRTLIWDLDVETRDLSRSLTVSGAEAKVVSAWVNGSREISRDSLKDALIPISSDVSVLMPPDRMAESMDLVCHTDGIAIAQRILELARIMFDVVIIDTGGRIGPATGTMMRGSDTVLMVLDDTVLGLTAVDLYISILKTLTGESDRLGFVVNAFTGNFLDASQIAAELEPAHNLGAFPWRFPIVPSDPKGSQWPGSGRTLYSLGSKGTRSALERIASELGLLEVGLVSQEEEYESTDTSGSWIKKIFGSKGSKGDAKMIGAK